MRRRNLMTAMRCIVVALLLASSAGPVVATLACFCPDGQVQVASGSECSCCDAVAPGQDEVAGDSEADRASCSACVDVPLRVVEADAVPYHPDLSCGVERRADMIERAFGFVRGGSDHLDLGDRLTRALISTVVLLT